LHSIPYKCLSYQATQFDQETRTWTVTHFWTVASIKQGHQEEE